MERNCSPADVFAQLSEFFKEPNEDFASDVASGRLFGFFKEVLSEPGFDAAHLNGLLLSGDVHATLESEYRRLFFGPLPPYIVPVESVYKRWSTDEVCNLPIAAEKGYLMGDPAIDMIKRYQAYGLVIPERYSTLPDHIALELEYMAFLCRNEDRERQREFLTNHLNWVDDLFTDIKALDSQPGFYTACAEVTALTVSRLIF